VERDDTADMRLCIMCNHCASSLMSSQPLQCAINATVGEAGPVEIEPAAGPRRGLVIGSGPAGMEAAHIAARRGHRVTLVERKAELGGQLPLCSAPPHKHELSRLTRYLTAQVERQSVDVRLGSEAPIGELLDEVMPDAVIVATGSSPARLPVPGIDRPHVVTAWDVMAGTARVGERAAIVGGGSVGVETALLLGPRGVSVTIVEMLDAVGAGESPTVMPFIRAELKRYHVRVLTGHRLTSIEDDGLRAQAPDGSAVDVTCDTVVIAAGTRRNPTFTDDIATRGIECHVVGDCAEGSPGTIAGAIRDGFRAGMAV
jgi:pyruvate/2-oxoglutarate dehydrogenase complex dihydrolipoamide dehydrogenase (E3) component